MSTFTMRLKDVIRHTDGKIGLDDYPITDAAHREILNQRIIERYFNREIGLETVDQFTFNLRRKMHEIMPYYDKLMQSQLIEFDPLDTLNIRSTNASNSKVTGNGTTESEQKSTNKAKALTVNSEFPQQSLRESDGEDADGEPTGIYAHDSVESDSDAESEGNAKDIRQDESSSEDTSESTSKGYTGSAAMLLMQYRESIANYDLEIVNQLNELFMSVWQTSEPFDARERRYL